MEVCPNHYYFFSFLLFVARGSIISFGLHVKSEVEGQPSIFKNYDRSKKTEEGEMELENAL